MARDVRDPSRRRRAARHRILVPNVRTRLKRRLKGQTVHKREAIDDFKRDDSWRIFRIMSEFVEGFEVLSGVGPAVSIFGSARTRPDDPYYHAAEETARLLVKSKLAIITGGGPGIMEA